MQAASNQNQCFKIFFDKDVRRVGITTPPPTFKEFQKILKEIFGEKYHRELLIQYQDEEGDRITVDSQIEWTEALENCLSKVNIKKFFIVNPFQEAVNNKNANQQTPFGFFKDSTIPPQPRCFYRREGCGKRGKNWQKNHHHSNNNNVNNNNYEDNFKCATFETNFSPELAAKVTELLQSLFKDGKIIPHRIPKWVRPAVGLQLISPESSIVDLDINIHSLLNCFHHRAYILLERKKYQKAKQLLLSILKVDPKSHLAHYNLACAESLLNQNEEALRELQLAVDNGYDNVNHILKDEDFQNISKEPKFLEIVEALKKKKNLCTCSALCTCTTTSCHCIPKPAASPEVLETLKTGQLNSFLEKDWEIVDLTEQEQEQEKQQKQAEQQQQQEEEKKKVQFFFQEQAAQSKTQTTDATFEKYTAELDLLKGMGIEITPGIRKLLLDADGDIQQVIALLFQ